MSADLPNDDVAADEADRQQDPPSESNSVTDGAPIPPGGVENGHVAKLAALHQWNLALLGDIRQCKVRTDAAIQRLYRQCESKDARFNNMKATLSQKYELSESRIRQIRIEFTAKIKAGELEYHARLKSSSVRAKSTVATRTEELKLTTRELKKSRSESTTLHLLIRKLETANIKLKTSVQSRETIVYQRDLDIKQLRDNNKHLTVQIKTLTKKIDSQLELKLEAATTKSRLAVQKEKISLQRDENKKRKKTEMIELEHSKKLKLHEHRYRLSTSAAAAKTRDKSREHKRNVDKAAARINEAAAIHNNGAFPNAGGGTGSIQQVRIVYVLTASINIVTNLPIIDCFSSGSCITYKSRPWSG
jgi:hypothetical protein